MIPSETSISYPDLPFSLGFSNIPGLTSTSSGSSGARSTSAASFLKGSTDNPWKDFDQSTLSSAPGPSFRTNSGESLRPVFWIFSGLVFGAGPETEAAGLVFEVDPETEVAGVVTNRESGKAEEVRG